MAGDARLLLPAIYVQRAPIKRLVHFSYIAPALFVYWRWPRV